MSAKAPKKRLCHTRHAQLHLHFAQMLLEHIGPSFNVALTETSMVVIISSRNMQRGGTIIGRDGAVQALAQLREAARIHAVVKIAVRQVI